MNKNNLKLKTDEILILINKMQVLSIKYTDYLDKNYEKYLKYDVLNKETAFCFNEEIFVFPDEIICFLYDIYEILVIAFRLEKQENNE